MKLALLNLFGLACLFNISCKNNKLNDSKKIADKQNEVKSDQRIVNNEVAEFLVSASDARMMGTKEGELAVIRGTTSAIKNYGKLMIREQGLLLGKIKKLAADRKISLPNTISNDKKDGFEDLNAKQGEDFDKKFIKMMKIDHERDLKEFNKATQLADEGVNKFAAEYVVMIQSHLDKIKEIKE